MGEEEEVGGAKRDESEKTGSVWVLLATPAASTFLTVGGAEGAGLWISVLLGFVGVSSRLLTLNRLSPACDVTVVGVANTCRLLLGSWRRGTVRLRPFGRSDSWTIGGGGGFSLFSPRVEAGLEEMSR